MKVAPTGRLDAPAAPPSATSVMTFPRMVMTWSRRADPDTPSIKTPARITVTVAPTDAPFCAQPVDSNHKKLGRMTSNTLQRFTGPPERLDCTPLRTRGRTQRRGRPSISRCLASYQYVALELAGT